MKIGITGATGHLGRLVITRLKEKVPAGDIVALARSPRKAEGLGVEVREADYEKPEMLNQALQGVDTLLLISASEIGKRIDQHRNVIDAAKKARVKWIVYTSLLHADKSVIDLAEEHRATEAELKKSGIPFTLLRNGWYTEIIQVPFLAHWPEVRSSVALEMVRSLRQRESISLMRRWPF